MKQKFLLKTMLLLCALIAGSSSVWADVVSGTTYNTTSTSSLPTGWSGSDGSGTSYIKLIASSHYIQTSNFAQNGFTSIKIKARTFGGPSEAQALITVSWYDASTSAETVLGTIAPSSGTLSDYTISSPTNPTGNTTGYVKIQCKGASSSKGSGVSQVTITYTAPSGDVATPTFSPAAGTYTSTQSVELDCETIGATIYYTKGDNPADPTDASTEYTGTAITVDATTTIKAIAIKGSDKSFVASATYTIYPVLHAGTEGDPYTVADARNAIDANIGVSEVYATGIVSEIVTAYNTTNKNISFNISADGSTTSVQLQAYRCKKGDGGSDPDVADIQVGDVVIVKGNLTKYGQTYEFAQDNVLISLDRPTTPLIIVTPTSLTGFTYGLGSGPSDAQTFSVEGSNLTEDITISLGVSSNYEMSLAENSGYTNELILTPTTKTVAATTIYVRLKAGLAVNASYEGTVTLTSTGATDKAVSLAGSVTQPNFTWDLSTNSFVSATDNLVTWASTYATMTLAKGSSTTKANNYLGGVDENNHTRIYKDQILKITPVPGYSIIKAEITAVSSSYVAGFTGNNWTNASKSTSGSLVTITPTNGKEAFYVTISAACRATAVKVYYEDADGAVVAITDAGWASFSCTKALDFTGKSVTAYIAKAKDASSVTLTPIEKVPANTGIVVNAAAGTYNIPVLIGDADATTGNLLKPNLTETALSADYYTLAVDGENKPIFKKSSGNGTLAAGKAYLDLTGPANELQILFEDETTGVENVKGETITNNCYYNLNGQRVAQPTKGLYIVNGRLVVIK